jgi:hypothetical protein
MINSYKFFKTAKKRLNMAFGGKKGKKSFSITRAFEEVVSQDESLNDCEKKEIITSVLCSPFKLDTINRNYK